MDRCGEAKRNAAGRDVKRHAKVDREPSQDEIEIDRPKLRIPRYPDSQTQPDSSFAYSAPDSASAS